MRGDGGQIGGRGERQLLDSCHPGQHGSWEKTSSAKEHGGRDVDRECKERCLVRGRTAPLAQPQPSVLQGSGGGRDEGGRGVSISA